MNIDIDKLADAIVERLAARMQKTNPIPPQWLNIRRSAARIGVSVSTFRRLMARPGFPKPTRDVGNGRPYYHAETLDEWLAEARWNCEFPG